MNPTPVAENFQNKAMDAVDKPDAGSGAVIRSPRMCHLVILSTAFWALVLYSCMQGSDGGVASVLFKPAAFSLPKLSSVVPVDRRPPSEQPPASVAPAVNRSVTAPADDRCAGRYIYMYDLPPRFNADLVRGCRNLSPWMDMCPYLANCGMGPALGDEGGVFQARGWYATDQFTLEIISHCRMKRYGCLTGDPSLASAVYVPFYAAMDAGRYFFNATSTRDALALDLAEWLVRRPEWCAMGGRDHFMVAGRTSWELERKADVDEEWGTKLLTLPAIRNMTALILETSPWDRDNFGTSEARTWSSLAIPYPTYFHPEAAADVAAWQEKVRRAERPWHFSFAGAPRPGSKKTIRAEIIRQCGASSRCNLFDCGSGASCYWPGGATRVFESSEFCLQPRGDTLTRRSTFDAILAGCIPVFFHPGSAYTQYKLHFPSDPNSWSVLIMHTDVTGRNVSIEETLSRISPEAVRAMREEVIRLIPRVVYADPRSTRLDFKDAFDIALDAVIDRVAKRRRGAVVGR
uniref:Exostosin GT47 domain-containing protein n=1 Tax=Setaria italica TaxID=4555 RepID=K4AJQ2_SETIT